MLNFIKNIFRRPASPQPAIVYTADIKRQYKNLSKNELIKIIMYFITICQDPRIRKIIHENDKLSQRMKV